MNIRWIYLIIALSVGALFAGNYAIVQKAVEVDCDRALGDCECRVQIENENGLKKNANPSCSVDDLFGGSLQTCSIIKAGEYFDDIIRCNVTLRAVLTCGSKKVRVVARGGSALKLSCSSGTLSAKTNASGNWVQTVPPSAGGVLKMIRNKVFRFAEDESRYTVVTETERVTLINGDGGFVTDDQKPVFMVTYGEAIVESFCDGSITRLKAPATLNMSRYLGNLDPTLGIPIGFKFQACGANELDGRWYGFYHRANGGKFENVPITIDLRQEPYTLETPDGVFSVKPFTINGDRVIIEASARAGKGTLRLNGTFDKGVMTFNYTEADVSGTSGGELYGSGTVQRLYVAQWAVSAAAVNAPYNHPLLALTPAGGDVTWSIVSGGLPPGISLDGAAGVLSGTPTSEGSFDFTVEVRDSKGDSYRQPLTMNVARLVINTLVLPDAIPNQEFRFKVDVSGGSPPYKFNDLFPSLPFPVPGFPVMPHISPEGEITFTPGDSGAPLQFDVVDSQGLSQHAVINVRTRKLLIQGSSFLPSATAGKPFRYQFETAAQKGKVAWAAEQEGLDQTGLTLNPDTGELSGSAIDPGVFSLIVSATDDRGTMTRRFTVTVDPAR